MSSTRAPRAFEAYMGNPPALLFIHVIGTRPNRLREPEYASSDRGFRVLYDARSRSSRLAKRLRSIKRAIYPPHAGGEGAVRLWTRNYASIDSTVRPSDNKHARYRSNRRCLTPPGSSSSTIHSPSTLVTPATSSLGMSRQSSSNRLESRFQPSK